MKRNTAIVLILVVAFVIYVLTLLFSHSPTNQSDNGQPLTSPDAAIIKLKTLCAANDYEAIALTSLKQNGKSYELITPEDITLSKKDPLKDYIEKVSTVCKAITNTKRTDINQQTSDTWQYRFNFSLDSSSSAAYEIHYFQEEWRLVLPEAASL